jgi:dTDP-4-amino-4,6-dideoxygalactose transaminase
MKIPFVDFKKEWAHYESRFVDAFKKFGADAWYVLGPTAEHFETNFAKYHGYKHAIGVNSGLAALEAALSAHKVGPGSEVITVANSAVATALAISRSGATPVFCDITDDYLIDITKIESLITTKTKAIMPVHLFGKICDMEAINKIAKERNLVVIEDACQAHGADYSGESQTNTKAFSFYPTKNLGGIGEGGMVLTNDQSIYDYISSYRNYGQNGRYNHEIKGVNYRIDALQCVFLDIKLKELSASIEKRRQITKLYTEQLSNLPGLEVLPFDPTSAYHQFVIKVKNGKRDELQKYLSENEIDSLIHYPTAIHKQPCYSECSDLDLPITNRLQDEILSLPCNPFLEDDQQSKITETIIEFYSKFQ